MSQKVKPWSLNQNFELFATPGRAALEKIVAYAVVECINPPFYVIFFKKDSIPVKW